MRKLAACLGLSILSCLGVKAQGVLNTTGASFSNGSYIIEYSVGEVAINTLTNGTKTVTQGVLQPGAAILLKVSDVVESGLSVYPNPVTTNLYVNGDYQWVKAYQVFAVDGKLITSGDLKKGQLNLSSLPAGTYYITLLPKTGTSTKTIKVIKQ